MIDFTDLQKQIYDNKVKHGFNTTDVNIEFLLAYGEFAEAFDAYHMKKGNVGEEIADSLIYLLSICNMLNIDIEKELLNKMDINSKRIYVNENGVFRKVSDQQLDDEIDKDGNINSYNERERDQVMNNNEISSLQSEADLMIEKIKVVNAEIVVHGTEEEPYYEIMYCTPDGESHIGYSSYDLNIVFGYRRDYFDIIDNKDVPHH